MRVPLEKPGTPEELLHFGVKGMKWGVRNRRDVINVAKNTKNLNKVLVTQTPKAIAKEMHLNNAPALTRTRGWKAWQKIAAKNVDAYNARVSARKSSNKKVKLPNRNEVAAVALTTLAAAQATYIVGSLLRRRGVLKVSSLR